MHKRSKIKNMQLCKFPQSEHTHLTSVPGKENNSPMTYNASPTEVTTRWKVNAMLTSNTKD